MYFTHFFLKLTKILTSNSPFHSPIQKLPTKVRFLSRLHIINSTFINTLFFLQLIWFWVNIVVLYFKVVTDRSPF